MTTKWGKPLAAALIAASCLGGLGTVALASKKDKGDKPEDDEKKWDVSNPPGEWDTIEIDGKKVEAYRWVDKREGKSVLSGEPIPYKVENTYWVMAEGSLVKFKSGPLEMVLESK